jgi:AraC-like DNA-binding protein
MLELPQFVRCAAAPALRDHVTSYYGFWAESAGPERRREGPGTDVVVIVSFGEEWLIDSARHTSFVGGLHETQVTTEHAGRSYGMQISLAPPSAFMLFGLPLDSLAQRTVPLDDVLDEPSLVERLHEAGDWTARFDLLDALLSKRLDTARPASPGVVWAWRRLCASNGNLRVAALAEELGWSRKRLVTRFREQVGLPPKAVARLLRFERARVLAERAQRPDWAQIALECGYYDQSHLINEFRAVTDRTPVTFFQDTAATAA